MAAKEIKQRIVLEGDKEYNQAIKEAQRNLKTLKSELKAETAELGKNATEQQKNETRTKNLKKQIQEQEKVVQTYRKALEEVKSKYGDNEDAVQQWERKLNDARATLANMKNDLDSVGQSFRKAESDAAAGTVASKAFADSIGQVADAGKAVSDSIESIFTGMVSVVQSAISAVWSDMVELAGRANAWADLAGFWNTDAQKIQAWTHAVEGAHNSFEDLNNAVTRINMGDQAKIASATGVSGENYTDKWEYAMAVMDRLAKMDYEERLEAAGEVFGEKRATKVMDLLNDWTKIRENLQRFDPSQGGIGLTDEQLQDMASLAEQVDLIKRTWRAFLDSFETKHFGKLALDLTGNAQRILDDLIKYLDTGSDEDLAQLEKDVTEFFDRVVKAIENAATKLREAGEKLEESENGVVRAIGQALQGLASALEWISKEENIQKVLDGFKLLAAFWITGKGVGLISTVAALAANFKVIMGFNAVGAAAGAASAGSSLASSIVSGLAKVVLPVTLAAITCGPALMRIIQGGSEKEKQAEKANEILSESGGDLLKGAEKGAAKALTDPDKTRKALQNYVLGAMSGKSVIPETPKKEEEPAKPTEEANDILSESGGDLLKGAEKGVIKALTDPDKTRKALQNYVLGAMNGKSVIPEEDNTPREKFYSTGPMSPVKSARMDATAEQQAAANAFWDLLRNDNYTDEEFDAAWERMEKAFEGNEKTFDKLDKWLDRIQEEYNSQMNETDFDPSMWLDLPATWWKNPAGTDSGNANGGDVNMYNTKVLEAMAKQVGKSIEEVKILMDGEKVARIVSPRVSQLIAMDINP